MFISLPHRGTDADEIKTFYFLIDHLVLVKRGYAMKGPKFLSRSFFTLVTDLLEAGIILFVLTSFMLSWKARLRKTEVTTTQYNVQKIDIWPHREY